MAKADPPKKKKQTGYPGTSLNFKVHYRPPVPLFGSSVAAAKLGVYGGQQARVHYQPSAGQGNIFTQAGTGFRDYFKGASAAAKDFKGNVKGKPWSFQRGKGLYEAVNYRDVLNLNRRKGWSKGGKSHKYIKTFQYQSGIDVKALTSGQYNLKKRFGPWYDISEVPKFGMDFKQWGERTSTIKTSLLGGDIAKTQLGLGKDRIAISVFQKNAKKYADYFVKSVLVDPGWMKNTREVLQAKTAAGKSATLFPKNSSHIVNVLSPSGKVKGLIKKQSKIGQRIMTTPTHQIAKQGWLKTVAPGAAKAAGIVGKSAMPALWVYEGVRATQWAMQWHEDNPGYTEQKYRNYGLDINTPGKYGVDY